MKILVAVIQRFEVEPLITEQMYYSKKFIHEALVTVRNINL